MFAAVKLSWNGRDYNVPAARVMGLIASVEEAITLHEMQAYAARQTAPMARLSQGYAAALRYAGAQASDEEVYAAAVNGECEVSEKVIEILMLAVRKAPVADEAPAAGNASKGAAASSKKPTKQPSPAASG